MEEQEEAEHSYYEQLQRKTVVAWIFALPVAFMGMFFMDFPGINWWMLVLSLPVLFYSGHAFYVNAWKQAKHFTSNMDTLVALSTSIAFLFIVSISRSSGSAFPRFSILSLNSVSISL